MTDTPQIPECRHHGPMTERTGAQTPEQRFTGTWWECTDPTCRNAHLAPSPELLAQLETQHRGTLTITHTRADGTLLEGSSRGDGVWEIVRTRGFRSFRSLGCLGIQQSRDKEAKHWYINQAAEALREAGWTVVIDIDESVRRSFAEAEADRTERAAARADRFTEYAGNAAERAGARREAAEHISRRFEFGQPILLGHHSQRRAERDHERMDNHMRASFKEQDKASYYAGRAQAAGSYATFRTDPPRTLRRIKKLEAELRGVERRLRGESSGGYTVALTPATTARLERDKLALEDELGMWRHVIEEAERAGFTVWGPQHFTKGDFALVRGRWMEVLRVNKKTLTVPGGPDIQPVISLETHAYPGMRGTVPYDEVRNRKSAEDMKAALEAARQRAAEASS